ncbi:MAG: AAA family ATPase [Candidatus Niyogibacteria bacterium]|nr:MAG: AAA family ATPase [Candidatus Niyogibacteria bacterium]
MLRIAILGATGVGKDTLCRLLANDLARYSLARKKLVKIREIQEYSVLWTDKTGGTKEFFEQFWIYQMQREWDHDFDSRSNDDFCAVILRAPAPLAYFFALAFADIKDEKHREALADLYKEALGELLKYDLIFFLPIEFNVPEGDRLRKKDFRFNVNASIRSFLPLHKIPFIEIRGTETERAKKVARAVKDMFKAKVAQETQKS